MTNEEKTFSILQDIGLMSKELEGDYGKRAIVYTKEHLDYKLLMEMAAWKEEQMIEMFISFLKDRAQNFVVNTPLYPYFDYKKAIEQLKQTMKGE